MNIQDLKSNTTWQEASNTINNNNNKISLAIATLENATLKNKGYFTTVEKLNEAVPNPTIGSKAYVGTSEPYAIYIVENGVWVDSGYTGGDEIVAKIATDRIEDGAVTSEKIATSAFDSTLSVSGKIAPADVVGGKLTNLEEGVVSNSKFITNIKDCFAISDNLFRDNCTYIQNLPDHPATIDIHNRNINITQSTGVNKSVIFSIDTEIGATYNVSIRPSKDLLPNEKIRIIRSDNSFMGSDVLIELDKNDDGVYYGVFTAVNAKSGLRVSISYNTLQISFNDVTIVEKESSKVLFDKLSKVPYTKEEIDAKLGQPTQLQTQSKIVVDAINEVASRPSIEGLVTTKVPENLFLGVNTYKSSTVTSCTIQNGNIVIVNETRENKKIVISLPVTKGKTYKFSIDSPVAPTDYNNIRIYANSGVYTGLQHGDGDNYYCEITPDIDEVELEIAVAWNNKSWTISNVKLTDMEDEGGTFLMLEKLDRVPYTKEESDKNFGENVKNRDYPLYITKGTTDFYLYADGLCNHDCKDTDLFLSGWHNLFPVRDNGKIGVSVSAVSSGRIGITAIDKRQNKITLDKTIFCKEKPTNPSADYNILFMGDSLVANKILPQSFFEMLIEYGYTNIKSVGRQVTSNGKHFEANGGYTWNNYVDNPNTLPPVFDKNWFWDAESNDISLTKYMQTYCGGVGLDCIVCNVLINHIVNNAFSELTPEEIGVKVRYFINKVHTEYPNCKIILNGSHFGHPDFVYPYAERREKIDAIQKVYYEIAKEFTFVYYLDVACYFDGRSGMQVGTRNVNPWSEETEQYVTDTVHPNECGYKMIANADVQCLLNIL